MGRQINHMALRDYIINVIIALILVAVVISIGGCKGNKPLSQSKSDSSWTKETPFDTLALIRRHQGKDHTFQNCDSLMKILAANNNTLTTKADGIKSTITKEANGSLRFRCETDSLLELLRLTRLEKGRVIKEVIEVRAKCERRHITDWEVFQLIVGRISGLWLLLKILSRWIPWLRFL